MTNKTIFISHATVDDSAIDRIATSLESAGHTVWVDHRNGIIPGNPSWDKAIRTAIKEAHVGVFVMTEKSLASDICGAECILIRELNKPLYVLRLEACAPENIFLYIKQIQYADLTTDFEAGMTAFLEALGGATNNAHAPSPVRAKVTNGATMRAYLPFLANPLRGRESDVAHIQTLLPQAGVTQIIGVGGWGKSRISAEIALAYPDGAVWHRCTSVSGTGEIFALLRQHFDLPDDIPQENLFTLLERNHPLMVIDNAEDIPPKSERRADYVALLNKIVATGTPVILTSRTVWDELKPRKQYPPPALDAPIAQQITADFAESQAIPLSEAQIVELTRASRNHPRMIELAVGLLQEALPYERLIKRLNDLTHGDMQDALNEMILKTVEQMRHEAKNGADAHALLRNLTWLIASFPYEAIVALKPADMTEDALDDAIITLGRYTFLQHDKQTGRYRLGSLVREALGIPDDDAVFNAYADFYIGRAKVIFVDFRIKPELWKNYSNDIENITALGNELVNRVQTGTENDWKHFISLVMKTIEYIGEWKRELHSWLHIALDSIHRLSIIYTDTIVLQEYEAVILRGLGLVSQYRGDIEKALSYHEKALVICHKVEDKFGESAALNNIGSIYEEKGNLRLALKYYQQAILILDKFDDSREKGMTLNNIGVIWMSHRKFQKALDYYEQALSIAHKLEDKRLQATVLKNSGTIWGDVDYLKKDFQKALDYYEQAMSLCHEIEDKYLELATLINIGNLWDNKSDFQKSLGYYEQSLSLCQEVGDKRLEASIFYNMGISYAYQNDIDKTIEYFEIAIKTTYPHDPNILQWEAELEMIKDARDNSI